MIDITEATAPKSDQLNSIEIGAPVIVEITRVDYEPTRSQQPVWIYSRSGCGLVTVERPWKPCKTALRVLSKAWGVDAETWVGKYAELYTDETVLFKGERVGGIRVSGLSHLVNDTLDVVVLVARGKKKALSIKRLDIEAELKEYPPERWAVKSASIVKQIQMKQTTLEKLKEQMASKGFFLSESQEQELAEIQKTVN